MLTLESEHIFMKANINFFIEVNKLKELPRTGWVLRKAKHPETIAEHTFRVALMNWIFAQKTGINPERVIKISLAHDLCEVYAGDVTPFFYRLRDVPKSKKEREKFFRKYVRLDEKKKLKRGKEKFNLEKKSLLKLIKHLKPETKREIFSSWISYETRNTKEGDFTRQVDKIETLLQAINYFGTEEDSFANCWWEECEENTEHPLLLEFLKVIQKKFYGRAKGYEKNPELEAILDFILDVGKLKKMPRLYWMLRGIKDPETVAGHIFILTIMAWIVGREKKELNMEKLLKMALCHELSAVYTGDTTPYDRILPKNEKGRKKTLEKMIRLSQEKKKWIFLEDSKKEKKSLEKLAKKIGTNLKKEMLQLWQEYRLKSSFEGRFLSQLNILAVLLQGLLYEKKFKEFSAQPLWEWAFENCEEPTILKLLQEMENKFS